MQEINEIGISKNFSSRNGTRILLFVIHTEEGNGTARSLTNYCQSAASQVSYHYVIDNTTCYDVVDTDYYSWSVLDANARTINLCFAGSKVSMSRSEWISKFGAAIDYAAKLFVQDARKYGFDARTISWDEIRAGKSGGTDHWGITGGLRIGNHTDVGRNFPWDIYQKAIAKYANPTPEPAPVVVKLIDVAREQNPWLGAPIDVDEKPCPDGRGKYRYYENGAIYWTPTTGAHPIPKGLIEKYGEMMWEQGLLGYPTNDHTVLKGPDGNRWGVVQGFERGNLYRRDGFPAQPTHGEIGNRWYRSGFENGPLGWPTSGEYEFDGGKVQDFENGRIYCPARNTIAFVSKDGADVALSDVVPAAPAPPPPPAPVGYQPTDQERRLTPKDGMQGGISYFAGPTDSSTRGRTMAITGEPADNPRDPWFCAMRFAYTQTQPNPANPAWIKPVPGTSDLALKGYLPGRRLLITNLANGRKVVVRPADWGPGVPKRVIDVSEHAMKVVLGAQTDDQVRVEWVDPATPLGPR